MKTLNRPQINIGTILALLIGTLCLIAMITLYSASYYSAENNFGDELYFVKKQGIAMIIGVVAAVGLRFVKIKHVKRAVYPLLILSFLLLGLIFIPSLGVESYGARRWLNLGFFTIQPSEISKFGLVLFSAKIIEKYDSDSLKGGLAILGVGLTMCVLLLLEPNMSVTVLTATLMLCMLFAGGTKSKKFIYLLLPLLAGAVLLILVEPYRLQRLTAFIDPWKSPKGEGYQLIQSYYALGSGGWFGTGYLKGRQKYMFLPFAESDFIFAIFAEEFGFVGGVGLIFLYLAIATCGYKIAAKATTRFESVLAYGISSVIILQTLINVAVVSGSIPPTGIPLPFMSYGGSSLVCFMSSIGVLEAINAKTRRSDYIIKGVEYGNRSFIDRRRKTALR